MFCILHPKIIPLLWEIYDTDGDWDVSIKHLRHSCECLCECRLCAVLEETAAVGILLLPHCFIWAAAGFVNGPLCPSQHSGAALWLADTPLHANCDIRVPLMPFCLAFSSYILHPVLFCLHVFVLTFNLFVCVFERGGGHGKKLWGKDGEKDGERSQPAWRKRSASHTAFKWITNVSTSIINDGYS